MCALADEPPGGSNPLTFAYRNYRGDWSVRRAHPIQFWHGSTNYHRDNQWMLRAFDLDKNANRDFAVRDMYPVEVLEPAFPRADVQDAVAYLERGGLGEVTGFTEALLAAGQKKVQSDTDMAMALCLLAADGLKLRGKGGSDG